MMESAEAVLDFWFGPADQRGQSRREWFRKTEAFDAQIRARFVPTLEAGAKGLLDDWQREPHSCLALIVVLDQFPRNLFRRSQRSFATDSRALTTARHAVASGFDTGLRVVERWFVYLPFEHAEDLSAQHESLRLYDALAADAASAETIDYAHRHCDVIARFGRFPHRNSILGRQSTLEEIEFLKQPGSSF